MGNEVGEQDCTTADVKTEGDALVNQDRMDSGGIKPPSSLGADVYENATVLNFQIATKAPAILLALGKITNSDIASSAGGMVVGAISFFGNRYYRSRGDDSAYAYMGQLIGAIQFSVGFLAFAAEAYGAFATGGGTTAMMQVMSWSGSALAVTETALILFNSYLYGDGAAPKDGPKPKLS